MVIFTGGESVAIFTEKQIINHVSLGILRGIRLAAVGVLQRNQKLSYLSISAATLPVSSQIIPPLPPRLSVRG